MSFISGVKSVDRFRTSGESDGVRVAGQQIKMTASLIADPVPGDGVRETSAMGRFLARIDQVDDAATRQQMQLIADQISGNGMPWKIGQHRYGMTTKEADALLVTP